MKLKKCVKYNRFTHLINKEKDKYMIDKEYLKTLNVLYYEPDLNISNIFYRKLFTFFNNIDVCNNVIEAYNKATLKEYDLIIMEVTEKGTMLLKNIDYIRIVNSNIQIYVLTEQLDSSYLLNALESKVNKYILKPLNETELLKIISSEKNDKKELQFSNTPKFQFGNIVVIENNLIGCIVKTWKSSQNKNIYYEIYVREYNQIKEYNEDTIKHFVYDKETHYEK
jgi:response regulator RpfG family c-di-GMP phosphodiesterase